MTPDSAIERVYYGPDRPPIDADMAKALQAAGEAGMRGSFVMVDEGGPRVGGTVVAFQDGWASPVRMRIRKIEGEYLYLEPLPTGEHHDA